MEIAASIVWEEIVGVYLLYTVALIASAPQEIQMMIAFADACVLAIFGAIETWK